MKNHTIIADSSTLTAGDAPRSLVKSLFDRIKAWAVRYGRRRQVFRLMELDDRMLADIGVNRADLDYAYHRGASSDATLVLQQIARRKRTGNRAVKYP